MEAIFRQFLLISIGNCDGLNADYFEREIINEVWMYGIEISKASS